MRRQLIAKLQSNLQLIQDSTDRKRVKVKGSENKKLSKKIENSPFVSLAKSHRHRKY